MGRVGELNSAPSNTRADLIAWACVFGLGVVCNGSHVDEAVVLLFTQSLSEVTSIVRVIVKKMNVENISGEMGRPHRLGL